MSKQQEYLNKMKPYAEKASAKLGNRLSWKVILVQWAHETGWGGSAAAKNLNNHAGIKSNSNGRDYNGGTYAGYNNLDSFVNDYVRVMNLSYYKNVKGNDRNQIIELHKSPWAEDPNYDDKLIAIYNSLDFGSIKTDTSSGGGGGLNLSLDGLSSEEIQKYALVGLGLITIVKLIK